MPPKGPSAAEGWSILVDEAHLLAFTPTRRGIRNWGRSGQVLLVRRAQATLNGKGPRPGTDVMEGPTRVRHAYQT